MMEPLTIPSLELVYMYLQLRASSSPEIGYNPLASSRGLLPRTRWSCPWVPSRARSGQRRWKAQPEGVCPGCTPTTKKRFRTKFTPEQKGKMLCFAEKVGWTLQREEEGEVQQLCQEIGVRRRMLIV